ncbi:MAG TPA: hypothetical protein VHD81_04030 [Mycobacteriales bacterium]|nr:hypothetical protein [Mycobacteriales bacterium]
MVLEAIEDKAAMARTRKKGVVDGDRHFHAVVLKLTGPKAMCGAGRIALTLPEPFDPDERLACARCKAVLADATYF